MNSSAKNHYEKDLKPPSLSSHPYQKDIKPPPPSSRPFDQTSTTGYPVIDPPSARPPLHIQSQRQVPWSSGLCDCCQDVGTCCLTCWCPCITFGRIVACGVSGTCYTLLWMVFGTSSLCSCFYRTKLGGQFHLHGNQCTDCLIHCFCETCAVCQENRDLKNRGFDREIGWHANVERQTPGITALPPSVIGGMSRA